MSRDLCPIRECLDELTKLVKSGASGNFYLAGPDNDIVAITILRGGIDAVNFQGRRGDFAVELMKDLEIARWSFRAEQISSAKYSQLSDSARRWLTGLPTPARVAPSVSAPSANTPSGEPDLGKYRRSVESIALSFMGPIAVTLCESAFADCSTFVQVVDELATNLPASEASRFRNEIAKIIRA
jgi:hypothetical protein